MGMTMTEKIMARASGKASVSPGENVWVQADILMTHDVCGPPTFGIFHDKFGKDAKVWDRKRVIIMPDHYVFTLDDNARRNLQTLRDFAAEQDIPYFYDFGTDRYRGVCHASLPEEGHIRPGELLFGTDSHTCTAGAFGQFATGIGNTDAAFVLGTGKLWLKVPPTRRFVWDGEIADYLMAKDMILHIIGDIGVDGGTYRALEYAGSAVEALDVYERMAMTNMAIEAGGKNGIIAADKKTIEFVKDRTKRAGTPSDFEVVTTDADAKFLTEATYDATKLEPTVAKPHSPDNRALARELGDIKPDRCYIGSCTGGKIPDFRAAARILKGREVKIETFIVPATTHHDQAMDRERIGDKTIREILVDAGCRIGPPSCAACLGGPCDTFGRLQTTEVCISSTNRNFPGRMGSKQASVYLASPLTVAATAVKGCITDPREVL